MALKKIGEANWITFDNSSTANPDKILSAVSSANPFKKSL